MFTLDFTQSGTPGITGLPNASVQVTTEGSDLRWEFGGGAMPNVSLDHEPTVVLGAPGRYKGEVLVDGEARLFYIVVLRPTHEGQS